MIGIYEVSLSQVNVCEIVDIRSRIFSCYVLCWANPERDREVSSPEECAACVQFVAKIEREDALFLVAVNIGCHGFSASRIVVVGRIERWLLSGSADASLVVGDGEGETKLFGDPG